MVGASDYDLDELLTEYLGSPKTSQEVRVAGLKRLKADFANEPHQGKRMALWLVLAMVGAAPSVSASFSDKTDRITARTLAKLLTEAGRADSNARMQLNS